MASGAAIIEQRRGPNLLDSLPLDCLGTVAGCLSVQDTTRLASASKARLLRIPASNRDDCQNNPVKDKTHELTLQLFLASRASAERALLPAMSRSNKRMASRLILNKSGISAKVGIQVLRTLGTMSPWTLRDYRESCLDYLPPYQLFQMETLFFENEQALRDYMIPRLQGPIAADWLGQILIKIAQTTTMDPDLKKTAIALLLEKENIDIRDVSTAFKCMIEFPSDPRNEDMLLNVLSKRPELHLIYKQLGVLRAVEHDYRRLVAALVDSSDASVFSRAFFAAIMFGEGYPEILTDLLASRFSSSLTLDHLSDAVTVAAALGDLEIVQILLSFTDDLSRLQTTAAHVVALANGDDVIVQLIESYHQHL